MTTANTKTAQTTVPARQKMRQIPIAKGLNDTHSTTTCWVGSAPVVNVAVEGKHANL